MDNALQLVEEYASAGTSLRNEFFQTNAEKIRMAAFNTAIRIAKGGKLLLCGNGGSAADAQHVAGEFINRFLLDRPALPAIALTTDSSVLTAIANDSAYENIFARQIEALGTPGDVLFAISTSGKSPNVLRALAAAKARDIYAIGLCGNDAASMDCDLVIAVPSRRTPLIQEIHLAVEHVFCFLCDHYLFEHVDEITPFIQESGAMGKDADL